MEAARLACHTVLTAAVDGTPLNSPHPSVQQALNAIDSACTSFIQEILSVAPIGSNRGAPVTEVRIAQAQVRRYVQGDARVGEVFDTRDMITLCLSRAYAATEAAQQGLLPATIV